MTLADLELFYNGPIPQHELDALRGARRPSLAESIAAAEAAVVASRHNVVVRIEGLRAAIANERFHGHADIERRLVRKYWQLYRAAQAELRALLDIRWSRKLSLAAE